MERPDIACGLPPFFGSVWSDAILEDWRRGIHQEIWVFFRTTNAHSVP